jgi:hypothetical protein
MMGDTEMPTDWSGESIERATKAKPIPKNDSRCSWKTNGNRCYMVGDISPDIGDGRRNYCHWHFVCLRNPKDADNFEEFCRWNQGWERYCSVENHYKPGIVWDAITGLAPIHGDPHWCGLIDCKHFDIVYTTTRIKEHKGLEVGKWWREHCAQVGIVKKDPRVIRAAEHAMWTPKTILARQKLGLDGGIVEQTYSEVPF